MHEPPNPNTRAMTLVLRTGTVLSTTLLAAGVVLSLAAPQARETGMLLAAGLGILLVTPVAHLLVAIADEIAAREWSFVALGAVVLLLLCGSLLVAASAAARP